MTHTVNPKNFYNCLHFIDDVIAIWPIKIGANKREIIIHEIKWCIAFINVTGLMVPLLLGVYYFRNDSMKMTKTLSELTALSEIFINLIQCRIKKHHFHTILSDIENFIDNANREEDILLRKYIKKYKNFQLFVGSSFISTAILFSCMPIVTSEILPADAWYPFSVEPFRIRTLLYITQVLAICQTAFGIFVDFTVAMMLWYSASQVELLERRLTMAASTKELKICARRHQDLILLINNVKDGVQFIILKTNATMIVAVVCGAFQLIHHEPLEVLLRFILMVIAGCFRLYVTAKPADDLKENSEQLARTAFQTALLQKSSSTAKLTLMLAIRCQKPMVLSVAGIIKSYTLQYYASFLSSTVTYFVNIRAVLDG